VKLFWRVVLGGDGDEQGVAPAEFGLEFAPGFEFGDAVGVPAAAEELDDEGAEGEEVGGTDGPLGEGVFESKGWGLDPGFQDTVFDAGVEEVFGGFFRRWLDARAGRGLGCSG